MRTAASDKGFTLIELVIYIVVLSVALTGVLAAYRQMVSHSADPMIRARSYELAQRYLDEILPMRFNENSGSGGVPRCGSNDAGAQSCSTAIGNDGEGRSDYDDVDDYNNLSETPTGYPGYTVTVGVSQQGGELGLAASAALRIDVTVANPLGDSLTVSAYRVNF